jgi:DUF1365 family protein
MTSLVYTGGVSHARVEPVGHQFSHHATFCVFDVDELPALARRIGLLGHNRRRPLAVHDADYLTPGHGSLRAKLAAVLEIDVDAPASIFLLTGPRVFGYAFNPLSVFWCVDESGDVRGGLLQVANTYGETHLYPLRDPEPEAGGRAVRFRVAKQFFVSPFNDLRGEYRVRLSSQGPEVSVAVDLWREDRLVLASRLWGSGVPITRRSLAARFLRGGLDALLTRPRIARQALALRFGKRLPDLMKPRPSHALTFTSAERSAAMQGPRPT